MSKSSDAVRRWRQNVKLRAINAMGGACVICGYKKCANALDFHHLDPETKEFEFGKIVANPKKQERIADELAKCILLCANCHREAHADLLILQGIKSVFDREKFLKKPALDMCPICGIMKPIINKTCSRSCGSTKQPKMDSNHQPSD